MSPWPTSHTTSLQSQSTGPVRTMSTGVTTTLTTATRAAASFIPPRALRAAEANPTAADTATARATPAQPGGHASQWPGAAENARAAHTTGQAHAPDTCIPTAPSPGHTSETRVDSSPTTVTGNLSLIHISEPTRL